MMTMRPGDGGVENPSPQPRIQSQFYNTVSVQKLRRVNLLILLLRFATFCFSLAAAVFMFANSRGNYSPSWIDYDSFRYVAIANGIVAVYSLFEVVAAFWEVSRGTTFLPEIFQLWFDFGHDQVFAYMLMSANSAGTAFLRTLQGSKTCNTSNAFCIQSDISIALGFAGFLFLGCSSLLSGFRVICYILSGSRFHV